MTYFVWLASLLVFTPCLLAKSLGTIGQTFPVMEKSLLTLIYERLNTFSNDGTLAEMEQKWVHQVANSAIRPAPLFLARTDTTKTHFYTPVATLTHDIKDASGRIILARGISVNALQQLPLYAPVWVFINYDDKAQRRYADTVISNYPAIKWILTGGNVRDAEARLHETVYFDQAGTLTKKLSITHVPALVTREQHTLKIVELAIGEDGHAL